MLNILISDTAPMYDIILPPYQRSIDSLPLKVDLFDALNSFRIAGVDSIVRTVPWGQRKRKSVILIPLLLGQHINTILLEELAMQMPRCHRLSLQSRRVRISRLDITSSYYRGCSNTAQSYFFFLSVLPE
jgi:hypothetical protein